LTPTGRAAVPLSWAFYDFANTIYSYAVVSYAIGLWSVDRLGKADGQFWVLFAGAASVLLNAIVSPVLGAMSDRTGGRMRYLLFFTAVTVLGSALIGAPCRCTTRSTTLRCTDGPKTVLDGSLARRPARLATRHAKLACIRRPRR